MSADTATPKRTKKALPVAVERQQWETKVKRAEDALRVALDRVAALSGQRLLIPVAFVAGLGLGWLL